MANHIFVLLIVALLPIIYALIIYSPKDCKENLLEAYKEYNDLVAIRQTNEKIRPSEDFVKYSGIVSSPVIRIRQAGNVFIQSGIRGLSGTIPDGHASEIFTLYDENMKSVLSFSTTQTEYVLKFSDGALEKFPKSEKQFHFAADLKKLVVWFNDSTLEYTKQISLRVPVFLKSTFEDCYILTLNNLKSIEQLKTNFTS